MLDWTRYFLDLSRPIEKIHLIVLLPDFVRQAAGPRLDFVEFKFLLVVTRFAYVYFFIGGKSARSSSAVAGEEHDETSVHYFVYVMVAVLPGFHYFVRIEVLFVLMNGPLGSVVPDRVDPFLTLSILPRPVDLGHNRL